jgi:hypothetical protein
VIEFTFGLFFFSTEARADARAADLAPTIKDIQANGARSLRAIARKGSKLPDEADYVRRPISAGGPSDTVIRRRASVLVCHFRFPMEEWER